MFDSLVKIHKDEIIHTFHFEGHVQVKVYLLFNTHASNKGCNHMAFETENDCFYTHVSFKPLMPNSRNHCTQTTANRFKI